MPSIERFARAAGRVITARPRPVLALALAAAAGLGAFAPRMRFDASAETLLTKDNEPYIRSRVMYRRFAPEEFLIVAYAPKGDSVFSRRTLEALRELSAGIRRLKRVASVRSILDVPLLRRLPRAREPGGELAEWTAAERDFSPEELRAELAGHPVYEDLLINKKQSAAALYVSFKKDAEIERLYNRITELQERSLAGELSREQRGELERLKAESEPRERRLDALREREIRAIRELLARHGGEAETYMGGVHVLAFQLIRIIQNDLAVFGAAVAVAVCGLLALLFRRARWVLALAATLTLLPVLLLTFVRE